MREKSVKGVVYTSPMFKMRPEVAKPYLIAISKFLSDYLPKLPIPKLRPESGMTHNLTSKLNFVLILI